MKKQLLTLLLCSSITLHASEAVQDARDYVSARVQMRIGESVAADLPANLIDQVAEVLDVLGTNDAAEKQFVELHAPLWAGAPTAAYLKKVTPGHDTIAQKVPAAHDSLKRFTVALQKQYGSRWGVWAKRAAITAAVAGAIVLLRRWYVPSRLRLSDEKRKKEIRDTYPSPNLTTIIASTRTTDFMAEGRHRKEIEVMYDNHMRRLESAPAERPVLTHEQKALFAGKRFEYLTDYQLGLLKRHLPVFIKKMRAERELLRAFVVKPNRSGSKYEYIADIIKGTPLLSKRFYRWMRKSGGWGSERRAGVLSTMYAYALKFSLPHGFTVLKATSSNAIILGNESLGIVLKVPNPYTNYPHQRSFISGENHSVRRQVRRVKSAREITKQLGRFGFYGVQSYLAIRPGAEPSGLINDETTVVIEDHVGKLVPQNEDQYFLRSEDLPVEAKGALREVRHIVGGSDFHSGNLAHLQGAGVVYFDTERPQARHNPYGSDLFLCEAQETPSSIRNREKDVLGILDRPSLYRSIRTKDYPLRVCAIKELFKALSQLYKLLPSEKRDEEKTFMEEYLKKAGVYDREEFGYAFRDLQNARKRVHDTQ